MTSSKTHEAGDAIYIEARRLMVEEIRAMAEETVGYGAGPISERVLAAMAAVPRHRFVPDEERYAAYDNHPLPIGYGQTISQPYIVALMTDLLRLNKDDTVLEVGTGCGYQTAILSELAGEVYSIEIVEPLARHAAGLLRELGYANVEVKAGDGHAGWIEHAPYDGIIVTAAPDQVPQALIDQLKPGGRLAIPVGEGWFAQELILITKDKDGISHSKNILPVRFVPLTGGD
ncbi:MAG: protein-L-isoaspartate(D-aspartate) O-methyltransferase [Gallionella sp.]|jgi:protein-L-isoaspartate(D-aspartate) O-methyltransferase|nr:protein-L-isoaspartate(D-aspartate) O-methyltransferase [Gallionella sp.]MCK9354209.1 protein-L-isoaspartate(D-aspartate) O-methyltransferase [Gallionella sp.]